MIKGLESEVCVQSLGLLFNLLDINNLLKLFISFSLMKNLIAPIHMSVVNQCMQILTLFYIHNMCSVCTGTLVVLYTHIKL